jgi:light-regulated signal transduction histidine kinase (bacteriophytochrome)
MRLLHQQVEMHNQILEEQVQIRTADLERSTEELTNFAYIASHDLQEPLRKIITFGDRLVEKFNSDLNDTGKDYIKRMQKSAIRMKCLIDDLLDFSRVTMRSIPFQEINLNEVISEVLSDLEVQIERTKGRVEVDTLPSIEGGKFQMRQLFQNLISNGLKYHSDEVAPVIKIKYAGFKNDFEEIYIEDNGKGFDEKHLDRIFRPFERLHGHNEYGGTGMGLAICHKIVVHHRGEITAKSQPNQGATFIVRLPSRQRKE